MDYIKKKELKDGDIFVAQMSNYHFLNKEGTEFSLDLKTDNTIKVERLIKGSGFSYKNIRMATPEEKHWLESCITADKFITFEEAMKTFISEYYEYIHKEDSSWKIGKIYKVNNDGSFNFESGRVCEYGNYYKNSNYFKPSTKEAYDAQFVVKEPEFVLPKKWCLKITKENLDFCKSLENNELKFHKNYTYSIGAYYSPIPNKDCNGFINIPKNYTEITFEQFKKYVLKEEIVEEKVIEPLPQFKVIETIETITKVENNEGNQFFIGDKVINNGGVIANIQKFEYNVHKTNILAVMTTGNVIGIDKIEHYIEPKVEVKDDFILPENWHIVITKKNVDIVKKWWDSKNYGNRVWDIGACYGIDNKECCSKSEKRNLSFNNKEITFDQFKKYVLKETVSGEPGMIFIPEETLLDKAKRLYPIGTKFKSATTSKLFTVKDHNELHSNSGKNICLNTIEQNEANNYYGCIHSVQGNWAEIVK